MTNRRTFFKAAGATFLGAAAVSRAGAALLPEAVIQSSAATQPPPSPPNGRPFQPMVTLNGWSLPWRMKDGVKEFHLVAEPVVREWIERNLGPVGRVEDAAEGAVEVGRFLGGVPALLSRGAVLVEQLDAITRDGLVLAPETVAAIGRAEARRNRWTAAALWTIALLLVGLVYLLLAH